jgi:DNA-binding MarR family transcriptional regulator
MSTLAEQVASSKSRISHQVGRMEKAGLVRRQECPSDGRGVIAVITSHGLQVVRGATPTHVQGVRDNLVGLLSDEERTVLAEVFERVISHLRGR